MHFQETLSRIAYSIAVRLIGFPWELILATIDIYFPFLCLKKSLNSDYITPLAVIKYAAGNTVYWKQFLNFLEFNF